MKIALPLFIFLFSLTAFSQNITITVDASANHKPISPYIYGRNNSVSDNPSSPVSQAYWALYRDAGVRIFRENGGNNCTKYNWRLKLSSHPDWYNNVYDHNWDYAAQSILTNVPNAQAFFGFQMLGKVASNKNNNFNDWAYNQSQWWSGVTNNSAGGGTANGGGDVTKYTKDWPADSTTAILDYWFNTLQYDKNKLQYWNMDNEPEIWQYTHDDAIGAITADEFLAKYFAVAKKAREKFPEIKLVGPATPNEWQWYSWNNDKVLDPQDNKYYPWMEYFIKEIAEEQNKTGIRLLDVLDVHFYPSTQSDPDATLQLHRVFFDTQYDWPYSNGVKLVGPYSWNNNVTKEYFFERCRQWLVQYMGANHGVTFGISEYGTIANNGSEDPNLIACWYASHLGTFANEGVELFTPWDWYKGQWEVLHMFSNYFGDVSTKATSSNEVTVSAYSSLTDDGDSLIIAIVNRDRVNSKTIDLNISNFAPSATTVNGYQLSALPNTETFVSKSNNALQNKTFTVASNKITTTLPKLSVTMIQIPTDQVSANVLSLNTQCRIFPNPSKGKIQISMFDSEKFEIQVTDIVGKNMGSYTFQQDGVIDMSSWPAGNYFVTIHKGEEIIVKKVVKE